MTGMLASVNSVAEAKIVVEAGADIVDIKNPLDGALGALEIDAVNDIVNIVNREILTSATIGDIKPDDPELPNYILSMAETGVDYVKAGLFDNQPPEYFVNTVSKAANKGIKLVVVIFAENYKGMESIESLLNSGIAGIMLDTREKKSKNLCALLNRFELKEFIETAKASGLLTGLAGSLKSEDIMPLLTLNPDYLGFRGALCSESDRVNSINKAQVNKIRQSIPVSESGNFQGTQYKETIIQDNYHGSMA